MQYSELGEVLYEHKDLTEQTIQEITHELFEHGTVYGKNRTYINDFMTMDIETSTIGRGTDYPIAFTYSIAVYISNKCLLFRTWQDYNSFIYKINERLKLNKYFRLICYVHNLPYEFQFMRDFMHIDDVFATKKRKVVKCYSNGIEYRCSYKLTNMGLARFTATIPDIKHGKLSGDDFDYSKLRTPKTELKPSELDYIFNDVAGLYEALDYTIKNDTYNLATIPNTSTGFVRDEMRREMGANPENRRLFLKMALNQLTYGLCRTARRGGNTHANPVYSGEPLFNLTSKDMSSAYPAVMVQCKFPMSPFIPLSESRVPDFEDYVFSDEYACIIDVTFKHLQVKTMDTIPYIPKAHVTGFPKLKKGEKEIQGDPTSWENTPFLSDNGRVLKAVELSMVLTDIDYQIIKETYDFDDVECRICLCSRYDYLPMELRKTILRQYKAKTTLKDKDPYMYMKQKNKFNANFGCMLTDICQDEVQYQEGNCIPFIDVKTAEFQEQLDRYYSSKNSFLSYQHGLWVTAHCRARLQKAINALGSDMVYCDTDSVKFFDTPENRELFDLLNEQIREEIEECGLECTVTYKDKDYTLGLWESDGDYKEFKTLGAKKYCYIEYDDSFHITVAGLSKSKARAYLESIGGIDAFKIGTVVPKQHSGRTTAKYNDYEQVRTLRLETGEVISVGSNIVIEDATYKFTLAEDYEDLLSHMNEGVMW